MLIEIVIFPGFDELDAIAPYEVLRNAAAAGLETHLVSLDGAAEITAAHGLRIYAERKLGAGAQPNLVIVPGGGWNNHAPAGARAEVAGGKLPKEILRLKKAGAAVASVCTGAMILSAAGILRGRPAITHSSAIEDLRAEGARIIDARVVDDGDVITTGGVTAGLDLALWLVERYAGREIALRVEKSMEYKRDADVWKSSEQPTAEGWQRE